ncbi:MAG: thioredoxin fold domain-containing protein [Candidatus Omnitrophica bacterium]|jgi:thioredoxin-related protein|nr:thioredoxin fold domain-containing protein [Candidatus Omnitrophota bacterium]
MKKIIALFIFFSSMTGAVALDEAFGTLSGARISYEQNIAQGDTMLFIWTSRCPYCISELREMNKNEDLCKYFKCFFVNVGEGESSVKEVVNSLKLKSHISQNIIMDKSASLAGKFSIVGVPTFIFMRDGKVLNRSYHFDETAVKQIFKK